MAKSDEPVSNNPEASDVLLPQKLEENEKAMKLVSEMLAGKLADIRPQLDYSSDLGFTYPAVEQILGIKGKEVVSILKSLSDKAVLRKDFFERLLRCPKCQAINLRPTTHCPKCASGHIDRGRVLEHFVCKYVGLEEEFVIKGRYICPRCQVEMRTIGSDYQSIGLQRKCRDCSEVFATPVIKWRCLNCSALTAEDRVIEVNIYSYSFNEAKRSWLEFELKPKLQLIEFLRGRGYEVTENATVKGRSGAEHSVDILATRDDGIITYNIAIGVKVAGDEIVLGEIFDFDDKAYDSGIHDKILIVLPALQREAEKFASQQRIKILEVRDLDTVLTSASQTAREVKREPFEFESRSKLMKHLRQHGYEVKEYATLKGRSGAEHSIDILATSDDGIVVHHIAIGIEVAAQPIGLDKVFDFDDKAYDIGILDKALIAVPGLTPEARQFAQRQKIRVFEVEALEPPVEPPLEPPVEES